MSTIVNNINDVGSGIPVWLFVMIVAVLKGRYRKLERKTIIYDTERAQQQVVVLQQQTPLVDNQPAPEYYNPNVYAVAATSYGQDNSAASTQAPSSFVTSYASDIEKQHKS
ncbi:hypothetical protein BC829DRAFT_435678 [Chytridium lagenaria]|nr:hypothetical protein BC829DRAFT_435678 [Chytridium lagenaria]